MIERKFIRRNSKKRQVLNYLKENGYINRDIAREKFNTDSLSKIVFELNQEGENIKVIKRSCKSQTNKGNVVNVNQYYLDVVDDVNKTKRFVIYKELDGVFKVWNKTPQELMKSVNVPDYVFDENGKRWKVKYMHNQGPNKLVIFANRFFKSKKFTILEWYELKLKNNSIEVI